MLNKYQFPTWLIDSPTYYVVVIGIDSKYYYTNPRFNKRFKHIADDFLGVDFKSTINMDDFEACLSAVNKCFADPKAVERVLVRKPNGNESYFWTSWDFSLIVSEEGNPGILCIGHDISDYEELYQKSKLNEQKLLAILDSTTDSNILIDSNYKILSFNEVARRDVENHFNRTINIGDDIREFLFESTKDTFLTNFNKALNAEQVTVEWEMDFGTGYTVWFEINYFPVYDQNQEIIGVSFNSTNIDKRKKAELNLVEKNAHLQKIAWNHAHEIRKPLANIMGLIELLSEEKDLKKQAQLLNHLTNSSKDLDAILRDNINKSAEI